MNARDVKQYLRELCTDIDDGRPLKPFAAKVGKTLRAALPVAVALSAGAIIGCPATLYAGPQEPRPPTEVCGDGIDNDGNGLTDCADDFCSRELECDPAVAEYMAPMPDEEVTGPGEATPEPDDGDGDEAPVRVMYGVPFS